MLSLHDMMCYQSLQRNITLSWFTWQSKHILTSQHSYICLMTVSPLVVCHKNKHAKRGARTRRVIRLRHSVLLTKFLSLWSDDLAVKVYIKSGHFWVQWIHQHRHLRCIQAVQQMKQFANISRNILNHTTTSVWHYCLDQR